LPSIQEENMKKLIFCFDGTYNDPEDVSDYLNDISISNILKLHIFLGGKLTPHNGNSEFIPNQHSFYYSGIGNRGNWLTRTINAAFAPAYGEMDDIISEAHTDLALHYNPGDEIYIFGFSRGAAIARMFAAHLTMSVKFLGVFDTVAATRGSLDFSADTFPASAIVFENNILAPHIDRALHLVALDEQRLLFQPTLFNHDLRVKEVWFAGSHSDIGGGYSSDGLSDICLQFMLDNIDAALTVLSIEEIDYGALTIPDSKKAISFVDLVINPQIYGEIHTKQPSYSHKYTRATRSVRVNVNERASSYLPIVHHSVEQRTHQVEGYQADSLKGINYQVLDAQGHLNE
jgi:uncharacterized protein (DUF2235 family)